MHRIQRAHHAAIITLLFVWLSGCTAIGEQLQEPDVKILDVQLSKSMTNPGFTTQLEISNPNVFPLNIAGIYYELEINGKEVATGTNTNAIYVGGNGAATTEFFTGVNLFEGIALLNSFGRSSSAPSYNLKAKLQLKGWPLPIVINRSGQIDMKKLAK